MQIFPIKPRLNSTSGVCHAITAPTTPFPTEPLEQSRDFTLFDMVILFEFLSFNHLLNFLLVILHQMQSKDDE
jgi:hypothetical protein